MTHYPHPLVCINWHIPLSYVAVAGLPEPRHDHAFAMARFASAALNFFDRTMKKMEVKLGPDTSELQLRIGK